MKKTLTRIFSVVLMAATFVSTSNAQLAKKTKSTDGNKARTALTMKALPESAKSAAKGGKELFELKKRTVPSGFRTARRFGTAPVKAVAKEAGDVPVIYGSVTYNSTFTQSYAPKGLYEMPRSAGATSLLFEGPDASNGGVCVDDVYYTTSYISFWGMIFITTSAYDVESGEKIGEWNPDDVAVIATGGYALDPVSGNVYGITYNSDGSGRQLSIISFGEDAVTSTAVAAIDGNWNSIAFDAQGQLYGISYEGEMVGESYVVESSYLNKIDKNTGSVTLVGETGVAPQYLSSAAIDTKTGRMFWNVCPADEKGYIYEVNLATGHADLLYRLENDDEVMGMYIPKPAAEPEAPAECKNVNFHFDGASLEGTVTLTTPATLFDGTTQGSGELFVMVLANGEIVAGGDPQPWNQAITIPVDLSLMGAGKYDFAVFASGDGGEGPKTKVKGVWVGADTPEATTASLSYVNGNMVVSWNAVTGSVNGGYIDTDNIKYKVVRADGTVAAEGLAETSFSEAVAEPEQITSYYYTVYAADGDMVSAGARTNTVVLGAILPPYAVDFLTDGLTGWTLIDVNDDGKVWQVQNSGDDEGSVRMTYNSDLDMDDWMITPPVKLESGKAYEVSFKARSNSKTFPERIEVKYGKGNGVADMTGTLVPATDLNTGEYVDFSEFIIPDATGTYYVGFHGISDADQYYLFVRDIKIATGVSDAAPGKAGNLTATPDPSGDFKAKVSFRAPDKTMGGAALSSLTKVELLRGSEVIKTYDNPAPGADLGYDDTLETGGKVTYTVIGYNAEGAGLKASVSAFVGFDVPSAPASAAVSRTANDGEVVISWDAVTTDVNGTHIPVSKVTYTVIDSENNELAKDLTDTSFRCQAVQAGSQDFVQYAVYAVVNDVDGNKSFTDMIPAGTPYDDISEGFADGKLSYIWGYKAYGYGQVGLLQDSSGVQSQDGDGYSACIQGQYINDGADFFSGLVSLDRMVNPSFSFYTYDIALIGESGDPDTNEITVSVKKADSDNYDVLFTGTVQDICEGSGDGWGKVSVSLADYANEVVQVQITGLITSYATIAIDNIKVGSTLDHDLKAKGITVPEKVNSGSDYKVAVAVVNDGAQAADAYSVELYADEELVETMSCTDLASGASATVSFDRSMSALATEPVSYYAKVVYAADENVNNNQTLSVTVSPVVSTLPVSTGLSGVCEDGAVRLSWNEPKLEGGVAEPVTDDFESYESYAIDDAGDWTFIDGDGSETYTIEGISVPNLSNPMAYIVLDASNESLNESFAANSGNKYLASFAAVDGLNDDWMISPELDGGKQTVKFFAKTYTAQYGNEAFEFLYSTGGKDRNDFVKLAEDKSVPTEWTEYSYEVPAGTKYFAIRCVSPDRFIFLVDDVTYIPAGSTANLEIAGYNVYRDGVKINDALVEETEYVDSNVVAGEQYTYVVTVVYNERGESAASEEVVVDFTGVAGIGDGAVSIKTVGHDIMVLNAEGLNVSVAAANGAVIYNGAGESKTVVTVGSGVYVVTAGKTVKKVLVK